MSNEEVLKALDELYKFFSISNNGEGEWNETHLERYDTGEAVYEHARMTRKELEYYAQLVNNARNVLSASDKPVDVEGLFIKYKPIDECGKYQSYMTENEVNAYNLAVAVMRDRGYLSTPDTRKDDAIWDLSYALQQLRYIPEGKDSSRAQMFADEVLTKVAEIIKELK